MPDIRISAADLLRLAAIASISPEGSAAEVMAILQRTGSDEPELAAAFPHLAPNTASEPAGDDDDASDKLAKPE